MCGFVGFLSFDGARPASDDRRRLLERMAHAIIHRGPDETTFHDDGVLALVFNRLSIVDVAHGSQPIADEYRNRVVVVNGEIYNHEALRRELSGRHRFRTASDSEVPLHAYEQWGDAGIERLHGMFALALWDRRSRTLTLARDRLGIKPLYVCRLPDGLLFGSELKGLLAHPACPRALDWRVLDRASMGRSPSDTFVNGVEFVPGGQLWTVTADDAAIRRRTYWAIDDHLARAPFGVDKGAYVQAYGDLLETVTHEHLQGEVGIGLHLSGGLDSSLLAALVANRSADLPCFTIVERTSVMGGDVTAAQALTARLGLPWHPVDFDYRTLVDDMHFDLARFEDAVWMMDSPRFDLEWIFKEELHRVAKAAWPGLKVVLLGQGADEFAGGYSRRQDALRDSWADYLHDEVVPNLLYHEEIERAGTGHLWPWLSDDATYAAGHGPYHRMMALHCRQLQQHNLWHEDRTSAWHGLEARVPFLDHRLVELLASVPATLHETLFWDKSIVRAAMGRFLPGWNLAQPKIGFLGTADQGSLDLVLHALLRRIVPDFIDAYVADCASPFDRTKIEVLARDVLRSGPAFRENAHRLLECMAVAAFERQCRVGYAPRRADRPVLTVIPPANRGQLSSAYTGPMACLDPPPTDRPLRLREGALVTVALGPSTKRRFVFLVDGRSAGQLVAPRDHPWLSRFLDQLGGGAEHTAADWSQFLGAPPHELAMVVGMLANNGLLAQASDPLRHTSSVATTSHSLNVAWH